MTAKVMPTAAPASLPPTSVPTLLDGLPDTTASPVEEKPSQMIGFFFTNQRAFY